MIYTPRFRTTLTDSGNLRPCSFLCISTLDAFDKGTIHLRSHGRQRLCTEMSLRVDGSECKRRVMNVSSQRGEVSLQIMSYSKVSGSRDSLTVSASATATLKRATSLQHSRGVVKFILNIVSPKRNPVKGTIRTYSMTQWLHPSP